MQRLNGKVAVVTGGNSGIGLATAKRLHAEGAKVLIAGRDLPTLDQAATAIGPGALSIQVDVSMLEDIERMYEVANSTFGNIDVLFANAGIAKFGLYGTSTEADFDQLFAINVKGVYFTLQEAIPYLNERASVILNTSIASTKGTPNMGLYAATKAAVRSFARTAAAELIGRNIRVNAVAPGPIVTPIFGRSGMTTEQADAYRASAYGRVPMRRMGLPEEVAAAVAFLASEDASYITGVELNVDGGMANL